MYTGRYGKEGDGQWKCICHIKDHLSKFSALYALRSKEAAEVAAALAHFFGLFGPSKEPQCDNGEEFKGWVLALVRNHGSKIINGRACRPQT